MQDFITILRTRSNDDATPIAAKTYKVSDDGIELARGYDRAYTFAGTTEPLTNLRGLFSLLQRLEGDPRSLIVRDAIAQGVYRERMRRLATGEHATLTQDHNGHHWVCFDIDDLDLSDIEMTRPSGLTSEWMARVARAAARRCLPLELHNAAMIAQWSSSAWLSPQQTKVKLHLWFWLASPAHAKSLHAWAKGEPLIDQALYNRIQVHYTSAPRFEDERGHDLPDPLAGRRLQYLKGSRTMAALPPGWMDREAWDRKEGERLRREAAAREEAERQAAKARKERRAAGKGRDRRAQGRRTESSLRRRAIAYLDGIASALATATSADRHPYVQGHFSEAAGLEGLITRGEVESALLGPATTYLAGSSKRTWSTAEREARRLMDWAFRCHAGEVAARWRTEPQTQWTPTAPRTSPSIVANAPSGYVADPSPYIPEELRTIAAKGGCLRVCQGRYYSVQDATVPAGVRRVYLRGVQMTGKTTVLKALIDALRDGRPIIYVSMRQALIADASRRLGLVSYKDIHGDISLSEHPRIAICADSLHRILPPMGDERPALLLLDESEQIAGHLFGDTIAKARGKDRGPLATYTHLRRLIEASDLTVAGDADLSSVTLEMVRGASEEPTSCVDEAVILHPYQHRLTCVGHEHIATLWRELEAELAKLNAGETIAVACTSRKEAERVAEKYATSYSVLLVTQHTAIGDLDVAAFLADPSTAQGKYDLIVASPTLATGVSVDWRVERLFCFATQVPGVGARDVAQMCWRWRDVADKRWRMWIQPRFDLLPTSREEVDAAGRVSAGVLAASSRALGVSTSTQPSPRDADHWSLWCTMQASKNRDSASVLHAFQRLCAERGYSVEVVEKADGETIKEVNAERREISDILHERDTDDIFAAALISMKDARSILDRGAQTPEERLTATRAQFAHATNTNHRRGQMDLTRERTSEGLKGWTEKGQRYARHLLTRRAGSDDEAERTLARAALSSDASSAWRGGTWEARAGSGLRVSAATVRAMLLRAAGIDLLNDAAWLAGDLTVEEERAGIKRGVVYTQSTLEALGLIEWIEKRAHLVARILTLGEDWQTRLCAVVGNALRPLGIKTISRRARHDGGQTRYYHLSRDSRLTAEAWASAPLSRAMDRGRRWIKAQADLTASVAPLTTIPTDNAGWNAQPTLDPAEARDLAEEIIQSDPFADPTLSDLMRGVAEALCAPLSAVKALFETWRKASEGDFAFVTRLAWG